MENEFVRDKLNIAGNTFILDRIKNLDDLVDQVSDDEFNIDERLPYWAELWPSSLALSEYILCNSNIFSAKNIIELGCGMGFNHYGLNENKPGFFISYRL